MVYGLFTRPRWSALQFLVHFFLFSSLPGCKRVDSLRIFDRAEISLQALQLINPLSFRINKKNRSWNVPCKLVLKLNKKSQLEYIYGLTVCTIIKIVCKPTTWMFMFIYLIKSYYFLRCMAAFINWMFGQPQPTGW